MWDKQKGKSRETGGHLYRVQIATSGAIARRGEVLEEEGRGYRNGNDIGERNGVRDGGQGHGAMQEEYV